MLPARKRLPLPCPQCKQLISDFEVAEGVSAHFCRNCRATWFPQGELSRYLGTSSDLPEIHRSRPMAKPSALECGVCQKGNLIELPYSPDAPMLVAQCPSCEGSWVQSDELKKIEQWTAKEKASLNRMLKDQIDSGERRRKYAGAGVQSSTDGSVPLPTWAGKKYSAEIPAMDPTILKNELPSALRTLVVHLIALPMAFSLAWILRTYLAPLDLPFRFLDMCQHELGHSIVAWCASHGALPLPAFTSISQGAHTSVYLCFLFLIGYSAFVGWQGRYPLLVALAALLFAFQSYLTFSASQDTVQEYFSFGGIAGEFVLSSVLVMAFYYELPPITRWDFWRFVALFVGAYCFLSACLFWWKVNHHEVGLPWGSLLQGEDDGNGDLNRLHNEHGWSPPYIVMTYLRLARVCGALILVHYAFFIVASTVKTIRERLSSR